MIYVPDLSYNCYVMRDKDTIRAYKQMPYNPSYNQGSISISFRDYYINSDYLYVDGHQSFSYSTILPECLNTSVLTDNVYYRLDLYKILICFSILAFFCIFLPLKIFSKFFRRSL